TLLGFADRRFEREGERRWLEVRERVVKIGNTPAFALEQDLNKPLGAIQLLPDHALPERGGLVAPWRDDAIPLDVQALAERAPARRRALREAADEGWMFHQKLQRLVVHSRQAVTHQGR